MSLKTLADHEADRAASKFDRTPGYATGIACPECGAELFRFVGGTAMLDHYKGRYPVFCRKCCHETTIAHGGARPQLRPALPEPPALPFPYNAAGLIGLAVAAAIAFASGFVTGRLM